MTLREELKQAGFNFDIGRILIKETDSDYPGWSDQSEGFFINNDHEVLDREYDDGYGGAECPAFIAEDSEAIYIPWQYDGSTGISRILKNIDKYIDKNIQTPYPGG